MILKIIAIIIAIQNTLQTQYLVSLAFPFLLSNNYANITTVDSGGQGFFIGFQDGQARSYTATLSSYVNLTVPEVVDKFNPAVISLTNLHLMNGTNFNIIGNIVSTLSNGFSTIRTYTYPSFVQYQYYNIGEYIMDYRLIPLYGPPNTVPFHLISCNQSVKLIYRGVVNVLLKYNESFGSGVYCTSVNFYQYSLSYSGDYLNFTYTFYAGLSTKLVICSVVTMKFTFNYTVNLYDLQYSIAYNSLFTPSQVITTIFSTNDLLLMQANVTGQFYLYNIFTVSMGTMAATIPLNQTFSFFYIYSNFYLLQSMGLTQILFNSALNKFTLVSVTVTLPYNTYALTFGTTFDIFYIPYNPYIYKSNLCLNQTLSNGAMCNSYSCLTHCNVCPIISTICQTCTLGYMRNSDYSCSLANTTNKTNTTNAANTTNNNTTNAANTTNTTNAVNTTNTANAANTTNNNTTNAVNTTNTANAANTTNNTTNATNADNTANTTNTNNATNSTNPVNISNTTNSTAMNSSSISPFQDPSTFNSFEYLFFQIYAFLLRLFQQLLNILQIIISVPAARRLVSPIFYYFGNFDDIYFYQFHDRLYGDTMTGLFNQINELQNKKWSLIGYTKILDLIGVNSDSFEAEIFYQQSYQNFNYSSSQHPLDGPEGIIVNCPNFFLVSSILIFVGFMILKTFFKFSFRYPISKFVRLYDFWGYFLIILFDGNVSQFAFYMVNQLKNTFVFAWYNKFLKFYLILFGFMLMIIASGGYLLTYIFYGKLDKLLTDNNRNTLRGHVLLLIQFGLRNLYFGVCHYTLRQLPYYSMLSVLVVSQVSFLIIFMVNISHNTYRVNTLIWMYIWMGMIRVLLVCTLFLDYGFTNDQLIQIVQATLIFINVSVYVFSVILLSLLATKQFGMQLYYIYSYYFNREIEQQIELRQHKTPQRSQKSISKAQDHTKETTTKIVEQLDTAQQMPIQRSIFQYRIKNNQLKLTQLKKKVPKANNFEVK